MQVLVLVLTLTSIAVDCPLELLVVGDDSVGWGQLRIDMPLADLEEQLGYDLNFKPVEESPADHALVLAHDRAVWLSFHKADGVWKLAGISILHMARDPDACWPRHALVTLLRQKAPTARYLPSRHDPNSPESENDYPMYAVDDDDEFVVLLKPTQGSVYVGRVSNLD